MVKEKETGEEIFLIFLDDNNQAVSTYVRNLEINDGLVTFKTAKNTITIPNSRIIKIKRKNPEVGK